MKVAVLWINLSGYVNVALRALASQGCQILVVSAAAQPDAPFDPREFDWIPQRYEYNGKPDANTVAELVDEFSPDVMLASWHVRAYQKACLRMKGRALRVGCGDNQWRGSIRQHAGRVTAPFHLKRFYDAFFVTGERQVTWARKMGFPDERIWTGVYTCDTGAFGSLTTQPRRTPPAFLCAARLSPEKGIGTLLAAYARYRSECKGEPWRLIVAGDGALREEVREAPGVDWRGFVQPPSMPPIFAEASCFVMPSTYEPWCVALHEAAAAGLPMIATSACGAAVHLLQDGYNGCVVSPGSVTGLATALDRISRADSGALEEMGRRSAELSKQFSPDRFANTVIQRGGELLPGLRAESKGSRSTALTVRPRAKAAVIHNHPIHYKDLLFQELTKAGAGIEVVFIASCSKQRFGTRPPTHLSYSHRIGFDRPYESVPAFSRLHFAWRAVSELRPNIVIISGYYAAECWAAWLWARLHKRPIVMWFETNEFDFPRHWPKELIKRVFVRALNAAHVYGTSSAAYLLKLGMRPERIMIKGAVANVETFSRVPINRSYSTDLRRRLIYVGRLAPEKNIGFLLRALAEANARLKAPLLSLKIVGSGRLSDQLDREVAQLGLQGVVEFAGHRSQTELPEIFQEVDFLVLPSLREPWGLTPIEGMLCGLPVLVSTQCGCAADVVTPDTGWTFSPRNRAQLVDLLVGLPAISPARMGEMGRAARCLGSKYSAAACAEKILHSLLSEMSNRPHPLSPTLEANP